MSRNLGIQLIVLGVGLFITALLALATLLFAKTELAEWPRFMSSGIIAIGLGMVVTGLVAVVRSKR